MPEFTGTNDVRSYFRVMWRWKFLLLAFVLAAPAVALVVKRSSPKTYKASALVGVGQTTISSAVLTGGSFSTTNVTAIAELVTTTPVAQVAAGLMQPPTPAGQIVGEVSATGDPTTNFITISAQDVSPVRAARIANAFARAITLNQQRSALHELDSSVRAVQGQIARVNGRDPAGRVQLQQQLAQLQAARAATGNDDAVLQAATPPATPTGLNTRRIIEVGLLIGLLLGIAAVVLAENADRRLRTPGDLETLTHLPLLASLGPTAFNGRLSSNPLDEESFQMLRTSLMYFNVDRQLRSVMIISPGEKDGKTTVASRLALAAATSGRRVVLVDADLRRAQVSARFQIKPRSEAGLSSVLAGEHTLAEVLVYQPFLGSSVGELAVLPAGGIPPNPSALLSSQEMERVLGELEARNDLVIIDTPAALAVSDSVALMRQVSGVILVARMNHTNRHTVRRLHQIVLAANGTPLGVVATGVTAAPGYDNYTTRRYYGATRRGLRGLLRRRAENRSAARNAEVRVGAGSTADS